LAVQGKEIELLAESGCLFQEPGAQNIEFTLDLDELEERDKVFPVVFYDGDGITDPGLRELVNATNEFRRIVYFCYMTAFRIAKVYMFPLKTTSFGLTKEEMSWLFDGVEDIFFGILSIVNCLRSDKCDLDLLIHGKTDFSALSDAITKNSRLLEGFVSFIKSGVFRFMVHLNISQVTEERLIPVASFIEDTDRDFIVIEKGKPQHLTLFSLLDSVLQILPQLSGVAKRVSTQCNKLHFDAMGKVFESFFEYFKSFNERGNKEMDLHADETLARGIQICLTKTLNKKSTKKEVKQIESLKTRKLVGSQFVHVPNDENSYNFFLVYEDLLILTRTCYNIQDSMKMNQFDGWSKVIIVKWFDFSTSELKPDSLNPATVYAKDGADFLEMRLDHVRFRELLMGAYNTYRAAHPKKWWQRLFK